jgi:hypothetical protein
MRGLSAAYAPEWLALREEADAQARSSELLEPLRAHLDDRPLVIRDLGCGTGSMARWLDDRLPHPRRWILHDSDPRLLHRAVAAVPNATAADAELRDVTRLRAPDLAGTSLVTASALLDLLTADEVNRLATACVGAGCPALFALSVTGRVEVDPAEPLDAEIAGAFNAHQRRTVGTRRLLGPDALGFAVGAFRGRGATVHRRPSPWRLGPDRSALGAEWLHGWVAAAVEQRPELGRAAEAYLHRRLDACMAGDLRIVVHHEDLLALPVGG